MGKIFDEHEELALLARNRFITFSLDPGRHIFSANFWVTTGPIGGTQVDMNLLPGHHYYISTEFKEVGLGGTDILMNEVTCEDARKTSSHVKPLEQKHLRPAGRAAYFADTSFFPQCPYPDLMFAANEPVLLS